MVRGHPFLGQTTLQQSRLFIGSSSCDMTSRWARSFLSLPLQYYDAQWSSELWLIIFFPSVFVLLEYHQSMAKRLKRKNMQPSILTGLHAASCRFTVSHVVKSAKKSPVVVVITRDGFSWHWLVGTWLVRYQRSTWQMVLLPALPASGADVCHHVVKPGCGPLCSLWQW